MQIEIKIANDRIDDVKTLFQEYSASLGIDLAYQNYSEEFAALPGKYDMPDGRLYIATVDGAPAGCVAMRKLDADRAEMKRLYVRNPYRGLHIGQMLATQIISDAAEIGYHTLLLDTLANMQSAQALYRQLGFVEIDAYYQCPIAGTVFMQLSL